MRIIVVALAAVLSAPFALAQLTVDQKLSDFQYLAGLYAKRYGPYEWKRDALKFDLLNIAPWLDRVRKSKTDLEYFDIASEYVSSLNDAHDAYSLPSSFVARLNFSVDVFDGKLLVDSINRSRLPAAEYPFLVGYELVSIDGKDAQTLLDGLLRYEIAANPRSTRRFAATFLTTRPQQRIPNAPDVPETSSVVFRRPDGNLETYRIPWTRSGLPLTSIGKIRTPQSVRRAEADDDNTFPVVADQPSVIQRLLNYKVPDRALLNYNAVPPVFAASLPSSFQIRLGRSLADPFFSGTFLWGAYRIGYLRIPTFAPFDSTAAINAFASEIAFFRANTDGLVVDVMRNGGGDLAYTNVLASLLMTQKWRSLPVEVRPTAEWITTFSSEIEFYKSIGLNSYVEKLRPILDELIAANKAGRSRTKPIPIDDLTIDRDPATDARGNVIGYNKPLILLVDETSASAAEIFAATIQDNARGLIVGWRTMGAGGNVEAWYAGIYSQAITTVTESLLIRKTDIANPDYPAAPYIENIGVRPDLQLDYMTADNLINNGKSFVDSFVATIVTEISKSKQ